MNNPLSPTSSSLHPFLSYSSFFPSSYKTQNPNAPSKQPPTTKNTSSSSFSSSSSSKPIQTVNLPPSIPKILPSQWTQCVSCGKPFVQAFNNDFHNDENRSGNNNSNNNVSGKINEDNSSKGVSNQKRDVLSKLSKIDDVKSELHLSAPPKTEKNIKKEKINNNNIKCSEYDFVSRTKSEENNYKDTKCRINTTEIKIFTNDLLGTEAGDRNKYPLCDECIQIHHKSSHLKQHTSCYKQEKPVSNFSNSKQNGDSEQKAEESSMSNYLQPFISNDIYTSFAKKKNLNNTKNTNSNHNKTLNKYKSTKSVSSVSNEKSSINKKITKACTFCIIFLNIFLFLYCSV